MGTFQAAISGTSPITVSGGAIGFDFSTTNSWTGPQTIQQDNITTTLSAGLTLANTTAATSGVTVQSPPSLLFNGTQWNGSASIVDSWKISTQQTGGGTSSQFGFGRSTNGGAYSTIWNLTSAGNVSMIGTLTGVTTFSAIASGTIGFAGRGNLTSDSSSNLVASGGVITTAGFNCGSGVSSSVAQGQFNVYASSTNVTSVNTAGVFLNSSGVLSFASNSSCSNQDTYLSRKAAANPQFGAADSASPTAQTLSFQSVLAGTSSTSGQDATIVASLPTGLGTPGNIVVKTGFSGVIQTAATCTISQASPAAITLAAHGFIPGQALTFATNGTLPTGLSPATTYYVSNVVSTSAFNVSATVGGSSINTSSAGSGTHTLTTLATTQSAPIAMATFGPVGLTGSQTTPALSLVQYCNTSGAPNVLSIDLKLASASGSTTLINAKTNGSTVFSVLQSGAVSCVGMTTSGVINCNNVFSGNSVIQTSYAQGASNAPFQHTGTMRSGGSGTDTFPLFFHQPTGTTAVTTYTVQGTVFGANCASGWTGRFLSFHVGGSSSVFSVTSSGGVTAAGDIASATLTTTGNINLAAAATLQWTGRGSLTSDSSSNIVTSGGLVVPTNIAGSASFAPRMDMGVSVAGLVKFSRIDATTTYMASIGNSGNTSGVAVNSIGVYAWSSSSTDSGNIFSGDTFLSRKGPANPQIGNIDAASPVAQTLSVQSVIAGTSNTAGANWTLKGSAGTGTGAGGRFIVQLANAGSTGSTQNTFADGKVPMRYWPRTAAGCVSGLDILQPSSRPGCFSLPQRHLGLGPVRHSARQTRSLVGQQRQVRCSVRQTSTRMPASLLRLSPFKAYSSAGPAIKPVKTSQST